MIVPVWVWVATVAGFGALIVVDVWQARRPHAVGLREAALWSAVYVGAAALFAAGLFVFAGSGPGMEFTTGYLVEKTLSIDNLFIFAVVMSSFAVPVRHRSKVLLIGIVGALVMRVLFIVAGAELVQRFTVMFLLFGVLLVYTAVRMVRSHGAVMDVNGSRLMRWARQRLPVAESGDGALVVRRPFAVTGLGLAVLGLLSVDVLFALDSIPAIFGITQNVYLVLCANAFALLGLRALYFLLVGLLERLVHLHYGLSVVLALIGVKLMLHYAHDLHPAIPEIPTWLSLSVIAAVLGVTTVTSLRASSAYVDDAQPSAYADIHDKH
ncbi:MAG TPA: TerC/Alx family metal homeostasis membrane protein [Pseudonocardiaceae bacterium]|nr:TerC/Alx family metal homeostasis membrane protein [Pseudonocardiaceae bacterium]